MFTTDQIEALSAPLDKANVKSRSQAGRELSYIEAWHAIAEANRIFGYDAWNRETVELRQLGEPRQIDGKWRIGYSARVRITVFAKDRVIIREGCGFGSGIDKDVDQAHESALKEAESDAMKRGLMTFGNPFGLALYDKTQANVAVAPGAKDMAVKLLNACRSLDELKDAWTKNAAGWRGIMDPQDFAAVERTKESVKLTLSSTAQDPFSEAA